MRTLQRGDPLQQISLGLGSTGLPGVKCRPTFSLALSSQSVVFLLAFPVLA